MLWVFHDQSLHRRSSNLERSPLLHGKFLPRRSEWSGCFTASLFIAGRLISSALLIFTANFFLASRHGLGVTRRVSSSQVVESRALSSSRQISSSHVGLVRVFHGESLHRRSSSLERSPLLNGILFPRLSEWSGCFTASLFIAGR